jgi:hypothetical protein
MTTDDWKIHDWTEPPKQNCQHAWREVPLMGWNDTSGRWVSYQCLNCLQWRVEKMPYMWDYTSTGGGP